MLSLPTFLTCLALLPAGNAAPAPEPTPAEKAWQQGQLSLDRDRFEEAIVQFQLSLRLDANMVQNHLSIAAAYLALVVARMLARCFVASLSACAPMAASSTCGEQHRARGRCPDPARDTS